MAFAPDDPRRTLAMPGEVVVVFIVYYVIAQQFPQAVKVDLPFGKNIRKQFFQLLNVAIHDVQALPVGSAQFFDLCHFSAIPCLGMAIHGLAAKFDDKA